MGKGLHNTLQIYLSKKLLWKTRNNAKEDDNSKPVSAANWLLSPCGNQPKTPSFSNHREPHRHSDSDVPSSQKTGLATSPSPVLPVDHAAQLLSKRRASVDCPRTALDGIESSAGVNGKASCDLALESPRSVVDHTESAGVNPRPSCVRPLETLRHVVGTNHDPSPRLTLPDMDDIRKASQSQCRFFVSSCSAATNGSLVEEARLSGATATSSSSYGACTSSTNTATSATAARTSCCSSSSRPSSSSAAVIPAEGVPVDTVSDDPYSDFRRSMQEMMDARVRHQGGGGACGGVDWEFMEDLLLCYLELNDRSVHGHVLRAFADITAGISSGRSRRGGQRSDGMLTTAVGRRRGRSGKEVVQSGAGGAVWRLTADGLLPLMA